jgi:hypothetical protein
MQRCEWLATTILGGLRVKDPSSMPPLRQRLVFDGDELATMPLDVAQGYDSSARECEGKPGQSVPKRAYQTWITGPSCTCPGPAVPPRVDDCRITDPDGDRLPGYTTFFDAIPPLGDAEIWGVSAYHTALVGGVRAADGSIIAKVRANETAQQFGCSVGPSPNDCLQFTGTAASCAPEYNRAELVPLGALPVPGEGWTCDAIMARIGELFRAPEPTPPGRCGP